jgi:hypothetical protein
VRAPVASCWAQRLRVWVSNSSSQGSFELGSRVVGEGLGGVDGLVCRHCGMVGWRDGYTSKSRLLILLTLALYQECNTLVTRTEIRIMRD